MQTRGFLTCRDIAGFLADYLADQIPSASKAVFERHLEICADCVRYLRGYEATIALTRQAYDDAAPIPEPVPEDLIHAVLAAR